jgi:hypothetical protein
MAYQIELCCEDRHGRIQSAGLGMGGNLYETQALAEKMRALRYGADDEWSIVFSTTPELAPEGLHNAHVCALYEIDSWDLEIPF